ncbi:MAG TPA: hypothetical protein VFC55_04030, partial [Desulfobaccales bacterium]|nr:hypothetical protein [Desulfobaccales bacterium]
FSMLSPVSGKVMEVNPEMDASPYLINHDPYGAGWIYRIELTDPEGDKSSLHQAPDYFEYMKDKVAQEAKKLYG